MADNSNAQSVPSLSTYTSLLGGALKATFGWMGDLVPNAWDDAVGIWNGNVGPKQLEFIKTQAAADVAKAGGDKAAQEAAKKEIQDFHDAKFPDRPLWEVPYDVVTGNPLGNPDADAPKNWTPVLVLAGICIGGYFVLKAVE